MLSYILAFSEIVQPRTEPLRMVPYVGCDIGAPRFQCSMDSRFSSRSPRELDGSRTRALRGLPR